MEHVVIDWKDYCCVVAVEKLSHAEGTRFNIVYFVDALEKQNWVFLMLPGGHTGFYFCRNRPNKTQGPAIVSLSSRVS